jgi:hypothetical protein
LCSDATINRAESTTGGGAAKLEEKFFSETVEH